MGFSVNKELSWRRKCPIIFPRRKSDPKGSGSLGCCDPLRRFGANSIFPPLLPFWVVFSQAMGGSSSVLSGVWSDFKVEDRAFGSCLSSKVSLKSVVVALVWSTPCVALTRTRAAGNPLPGASGGRVRAGEELGKETFPAAPWWWLLCRGGMGMDWGVCCQKIKCLKPSLPSPLLMFPSLGTS